MFNFSQTAEDKKRIRLIPSASQPHSPTQQMYLEYL